MGLIFLEAAKCFVNGTEGDFLNFILNSLNCHFSLFKILCFLQLLYIFYILYYIRIIDVVSEQNHI